MLSLRLTCTLYNLHYTVLNFFKLSRCCRPSSFPVYLSSYSQGIMSNSYLARVAPARILITMGNTKSNWFWVCALTLARAKYELAFTKSNLKLYNHIELDTKFRSATSRRFCDDHRLLRLLEWLRYKRVRRWGSRRNGRRAASERHEYAALRVGQSGVELWLVNTKLSLSCIVYNQGRN